VRRVVGYVGQTLAATLPLPAWLLVAGLGLLLLRRRAAAS